MVEDPVCRTVWSECSLDWALCGLSRLHENVCIQPLSLKAKRGSVVGVPARSTVWSKCSIS